MVRKVEASLAESMPVIRKLAKEKVAARQIIKGRRSSKKTEGPVDMIGKAAAHKGFKRGWPVRNRRKRSKQFPVFFLSLFCLFLT